MEDINPKSCISLRPLMTCVIAGIVFTFRKIKEWENNGNNGNGYTLPGFSG